MSQRNSGYERLANETYFTPEWVVKSLLDNCYMRGPIFDPCCGDGQIVKACRALGHEADGSDLHDYGYRPGGDDFFNMTDLPEGMTNIVMNPPYKLEGCQGGALATAFVEHALNLIWKRPGATLAVLLQVDFDSARTRRHLFGDNPNFCGRITLLKRIAWTNIKHTASPSQNHAWFIWTGVDLCEGKRVQFVKYAHPDDSAVAGGQSEAPQKSVHQAEQIA